MAGLKSWGWNAGTQAFWLWVPVALLLLYLFRPRHRPQAVAAAFLWRQVQDRLGGQSLWRRLQNQRLLWLQLLFCLLLILSLMRPYQVRPGLVARQVVLVMDRSASMAASGRFSAALQEARQIVRQAPADCQFALATLDNNLQMLQPFSSDRVALEGLLAGLRPMALSGQDERVAPLVLSILKNNPQAQVHWFSDHSLPEVNCIPHLFDQGRVNYSIDSFQCSGQQLLLAVRSHDVQAAQLQLQIRGSDQFLVERSCSLRGGARQLLQIPLAGGHGPYTARILNADDLSLDNQAFCLDPSGAPQRLLSQEGVSPFLEQAAQAATGLTLLRGSAEVEGIRLWARLPESKLPGGRHIACAPPASWVQSEVDDQGPVLLTPELQRRWRFRVSGQRWGKRYVLKSGLADPVLVDQSGQPLLVEHDGSLVWLFALENSELPLSPDLPVILSSWLQAHQDPGQAMRAGALCGNRVLLPGPAPLKASGPLGGFELQQLEWQPDWPGIYEFAWGSLAVNFYAPEESNLERPKAPVAPTALASEEVQTRPMSQEYVRPLVLLALLVLLYEYRCWWGSKPR